MTEKDSKGVDVGRQNAKGEYIIPIKLHHQPTDELEALNKKIDGIYLSRGTICENFPQNMVATFLLYEKWQKLAASGKYDKQMLMDALPVIYKEAITVLPEVKVLFYDKHQGRYMPYTKDDGQPLILQNVLFRQGYNLPFGLGLVTSGPYAGLILRYPDDRPIPSGGLSSQTPNIELSIERVMNDGMLNDPKRYEPNYRALAEAAHLTGEESFELAEELESVPGSIGNEIEAAYNAYIEEAKQNGEPLNAVFHVQKFCEKYGFPYNEDDVNYRKI